MVPFHSCHTYGTWRSKGVGGGFKRHPMGAGARHKAETSFTEGVDPLDNMLDQINN